MAANVHAAGRAVRLAAAALAARIVLGVPGALAAGCMTYAAFLVYPPAAFAVAALYLHVLDWRIR